MLNHFSLFELHCPVALAEKHHNHSKQSKEANPDHVNEIQLVLVNLMFFRQSFFMLSFHVDRRHNVYEQSQEIE